MANSLESTQPARAPSMRIAVRPCERSVTVPISSGRAAASRAGKSAPPVTRKRWGPMEKAELSGPTSPVLGSADRERAVTLEITSASAAFMPGHAAASAMPEGVTSLMRRPGPADRLPCLPGRKAAPRGDSRSTMQPLSFRIEEMVAYDLDLSEALAKRVGQEGARAVPRLAATHQRQADIFLQGGRIARGGDMADARSESVTVGLLHNVRPAVKRPAVERDHADEAQAAPVDLPLAVHEGGADEGLFLGKHPVEIKVARGGATVDFGARHMALLDAQGAERFQTVGRDAEGLACRHQRLPDMAA